MSEAERNTTGVMMVQLLFRHRPKSPTTKQVREALEKYLGEVPDVEASGCAALTDPKFIETQINESLTG